MLTARFWVSTTVVLCALLFQNCQSNFLSATAEEGPAASTSPSSITHQHASSESLAVGSLSVSSATAAHVSSSYLMKSLFDSNGEELSMMPSIHSLSSSELSTVSDSPEDSESPAKYRAVSMALKHSNKEVRDEEEQRYIRRATLGILLSIAGVEPDKAAGFLEVVLVAAQDKEFRQQALEALGNVSKASPDMLSEGFSFLHAAAQQGDKDIRLLALKTFGQVEWKHYFGEVGPAPDLPKNIIQILDAPCSFWPERQVKDTHLLVLIPAQVDGKSFTLNLLGKLVKVPKGGGSKTKYGYYHGTVQSQVGNNTPASSYWVLITRDVLPESRSKTYTDQKALVAGHTSRTGLNYELPQALEAATAILVHHVRTGERLYGDNPWTWMRCQELLGFEYNGAECRAPTVVGGFASSGLVVDCYNYGGSYYGVAGCRKFF